MRRRLGSALAAAVVVLLAGCSTAPIDPALTAIVSDAISAGASAQLGLELDEEGRILPGTLTTLLGDMAQALADSQRELEMHQAADAEDAEYREQALSGVEASLEAVQIAQQGDRAAALDELTVSLDELEDLDGGG